MASFVDEYGIQVEAPDGYDQVDYDQVRLIFARDLHLAGLPERHIAALLRISRHTVRKSIADDQAAPPDARYLTRLRAAVEAEPKTLGELVGLLGGHVPSGSRKSVETILGAGRKGGAK